MVVKRSELPARASNASLTMTAPHPTPEQLIAAMTSAQLQELLVDLKIDSSPRNAKRLRQLTQLLGDFELAVEAMIGPAQMRRVA